MFGRFCRTERISSESNLALKAADEVKSYGNLMRLSIRKLNADRSRDLEFSEEAGSAR